MEENSLEDKVVLVTGAARRSGAAIVTRLQQNGARVAIHYRGSATDADALAASFNEQRHGSAATFQADLLDAKDISALVAAVVEWGGRLDGLVNNASTFYPTPIGEITEAHWDDLVGSNFKVPLFLSQEAVPHLREAGGSIVNIVDIHARRPLRDHPVYGPAKAARTSCIASRSASRVSRPAPPSSMRTSAAAARVSRRISSAASRISSAGPGRLGMLTRYHLVFGYSRVLTC